MISFFFCSIHFFPVTVFISVFLEILEWDIERRNLRIKYKLQYKDLSISVNLEKKQEPNVLGFMFFFLAVHTLHTELDDWLCCFCCHFFLRTFFNLESMQQIDNLAHIHFLMQYVFVKKNKSSVQTHQNNDEETTTRRERERMKERFHGLYQQYTIKWEKPNPMSQKQ